MDGECADKVMVFRWIPFQLRPLILCMRKKGVQLMLTLIGCLASKGAGSIDELQDKPLPRARLPAQGLPERLIWVAVKELNLSSHEMCI